MLILNINGVLFYFPHLAIIQGNARMFGKFVNKMKMEVKVGVENFLAKAFEKLYVTIWSCMKFEDVLEVFPMLMPDKFMDHFFFIWEHE